MQCEICGKYIDRGKKVRVEKSIIVTCDGCSRYGEIVGEVRHEAKKKIVKKEIEKQKEITEKEFSLDSLVMGARESSEELVDNYAEFALVKDIFFSI